MITILPKKLVLRSNRRGLVNMKRKIFFLIIVLLLLVSCKRGGPIESFEEEYKTGIKGLKIDTLGDLKEYQSGPLDIYMQLYNEIGYDLEDVKINLAGFDTYYVDIDNSEQDFSMIKGRSILSPAVEGKELHFTGRTRKLMPGEEKNEQKFRVYINYKSKIDFFSTVCVKPSKYDVYDSGCEPKKGSTSFRGQGAPLAVTKMEAPIFRTGPEVEFRFELKNKGKGKVKKASLGKAAIGNREMECYFRDGRDNALRVIKFDDKKQEAIVICKKRLKNRISYDTLVFIEFFYEYERGLKGKLEILR